ncbi:MAG: response regulator [Bacteroidia bacterium]|jgi:signal transduction histidine kinase/CheY-like chemotaxis protein
MKSIWDIIAKIGIQGDESSFLAKRIRLTNQLVASVSGIAFCYVFVFYFSGLQVLSYITLIVPLLFLISFQLNRKGWYLLARLWFVGMVNGIVLLYSFFLGKETSIHYVFFSIACMPWLLFEIKDWKYIAWSLILPVILYFFFIFSETGALMPVPVAAQKILSISITGVVFIVSGLCIGFMSVQNFHSENSMAYANMRQGALLKEISAQRDELESQQEELRQINEELTQQAEILRATEEELRTQEEELRHLNVELEEKTESLEASGKVLELRANELESANKYKSEFLANMSHELRTPLNSVLILANLLKENKAGNLQPKQIEYASIIHKSGSDLLDLINDILDLSKIEAGKIEFQFGKVTVRELILDLEQLFNVIAQEKGIHFNMQVPASLPPAFVTDKVRIGQVLKNLLSNAFKFTPKDGQITLSFSANNESMSISVKDSGIGIPADKQKIIFEAFQQADGSTSRRFGGTGLGLSICKELVYRMGGRMEVISEPGKGSNFIVHLPLEGKATELPTHSTKPEVEPELQVDLSNVSEQDQVIDSRAELQAGVKSILIIDDDVVFARMVNELAKEKGYKTIVALSGDEGLLYARKYKPSAIILDLGLPVIHGKNILRLLKADDQLKAIPVHVITSEDKDGFGNWQVEGFINKPLLGNELELTFSSIENYIHEHYKSVLILSPKDSELRTMFETLVAERHKEIITDVVETTEKAIEAIHKVGNDCIVIDIGAKIKEGIETVKNLKKASPDGTYFIVCLVGDISSKEESQLKKYANSMIRKSDQTKGRLFDELELFLHRVNNPVRLEVPEKYNKSYDRSLQGKRILVADDDMRNVFALTALLEEEGMKVVAAENGQVAIDLLNEPLKIDLVLMDIMMPEMDGYEAMRHIRKVMRNDLPIIALTAKAMVGDREKAIESGASDYITKPVDQNKLISLMRVWLAQS